MKITAIKPYAFWLGHRNVLLVKVETSEGICGWGESGLSGREKAVVGAIEHFREFLIGKSALHIGALWQEMYRSQYFEGGRVLSAAIAAIDIALYDALGKFLNQPVYQLIGGKQRDSIPLFATATSAYDQSLIDEVDSLVANGWKAVRTTTGVHGNLKNSTEFCSRGSIAQSAEILTEIRKRVGSSIVLGVDYHHRLTVPEAISFVNKMPSGTLDFIEEPIRAQAPSAYRALREMTDVPLAIGEEFSNKWEFLPFIELGITDFGRVDICNAGGFTESLKIAALCESKYIDMMPHNPLSPLCTAASVHYCAAIANLAWLEWPPYDGDLTGYDAVFNSRPIVKECALPIPDSPGLGIEVNEAEVIKRQFNFWEPPRLHKPDGSYQNW